MILLWLLQIGCKYRFYPEEIDEQFAKTMASKA
jgi:hypothetical protein